MTDTKSEAKYSRCSNAQCGGIILADTEDWERPLCYECYADLGCPEREPKEQTYPTVYAYEQVCKALNDLKAKHERVLEALRVAESGINAALAVPGRYEAEVREKLHETLDKLDELAETTKVSGK